MVTDVTTPEELAACVAARRDRLAAAPSETRDLRIVHPSGITLPEDGSLRRLPPRPPEARQADYDERFDATTLFYDVFRSGDDIWLSGPPLRNLAWPLRRRAGWSLDGRPLARVELADWGRTQRSRIPSPGPGTRLELEVDGLRLATDVAEDGAAAFAGRHALVTKSQDNDLVWIQDWLRWYHDVHGVTAVVFYENNSTRYTAEDVRAAIAEVPGIEVAVVVDWPYRWGPNGGPKKVWDSDFSQYGMLENARFRYLRNAAGVINADVDELVLTHDGRTVFEHAAEVPGGVLSYHGIYIAMATEQPLDAKRQRRFADYWHAVGGDTTPKWTALPERIDPASTQWRIHSINGVRSSITPAVAHRHFQGITNGWKYKRKEGLVDPEKHRKDEQIDAVLRVVYGRAD